MHGSRMPSSKTENVDMETRFLTLLEQGAMLLGIWILGKRISRIVIKGFRFKLFNELLEHQKVAQVEQAKDIATRIRSIFPERKLLRPVL